MSANEPSDPDYNFIEIVKVGRSWHWHPDVTIVYISQTKEFKVEGGFTVKETPLRDSRQIKILVLGNTYRSFEVRRRKGGVYQIATDGYWLEYSGRFQV